MPRHFISLHLLPSQPAVVFGQFADNVELTL